MRPNWPNSSQTSPFTWPPRRRGGHRWRSAVVAGLGGGLAAADRQSHTQCRGPGMRGRRCQWRRKKTRGADGRVRRAHPEKGVRWRGRLWVQCRLRRAPPPLALFCLRRFGCCPDGLYVSAPARIAPPSSGPAAQEISLRRSFVADFLREFPAPCPAGRQASVGRRASELASNQKTIIRYDSTLLPGGDLACAGRPRVASI